MLVLRLLETFVAQEFFCFLSRSIALLGCLVNGFGRLIEPLRGEFAKHAGFALLCNYITGFLLVARIWHGS